jgi:hypothetical protein
MSPETKSVEACKEDVFRFSVETTLEKVAVFAARLETVKLPFGFVIAVELNRKSDT